MDEDDLENLKKLLADSFGVRPEDIIMSGFPNTGRQQAQESYLSIDRDMFDYVFKDQDVKNYDMNTIKTRLRYIENERVGSMLELKNCRNKES